MVYKPRRMERVCEVCGHQFQARVKDVNRGFGKNCSSRCRGLKAQMIKKSGRIGLPPQGV